MYLILKLVHVMAAVLFLGNIITGLFWKAHADRSRDPRVIAHTFRGIIRSDRWFTLPGVFAIVATGIGAAIVGGIPLLRTGWILWSIGLFIVSGVLFGARVAPLQVQIAQRAEAAARDPDAFDWAAYHALARRWELWGLLALLTPLAALVLMVLKPALPAL